MNSKNEILKEILTKAGGNVDDLPDNLETTILRRIAESMSGGGSSGGGTKLYIHELDFAMSGNDYNNYLSVKIKYLAGTVTEFTKDNINNFNKLKLETIVSSFMYNNNEVILTNPSFTFDELGLYISDTNEYYALEYYNHEYLKWTDVVTEF